MASTLTLLQPSGELSKKIRIELNEDVNRNHEYLAAIKEWLRKQPHLPDEWEDICLLNFLRGCNFSMEKCKRKLDMYFTMRAACPEYFCNRDITRPELVELYPKAVCAVLPGLTPEGRRLSIVRLVDPTVEVKMLNDGVKIATMTSDIRLMEEFNGISGDVCVMDGTHLSSRHLTQLSISTIKKIVILAQEAYPVKLKEIHVVNTSHLIETLYNIIKPFLSEKIRKRVYFHKNISDLQKYIPIKMLPVEFGGEGESLNTYKEAWIKKLESYTPWFKAQENVKANEALRPGKPTNYDELFGVEGSFRQLSID